MRSLLVHAAALTALAASATVILAARESLEPDPGSNLPSVGSPPLEIPTEAELDTLLPDDGEAAETARTIDQDIAAPDGAFERVEPRPSLSRLGPALPPKPALPDEWRGMTLYGAVATAAGRIDAKGYRIVVSGVTPLEADETCGSGESAWPCGARARAAFRAMLRGRAVECIVPPEPERTVIAASCSVGGRDIGAWLVENGWARADPGSTYAALGETAERTRTGMFGASPVLAAPPLSSVGSALPTPPAPPQASPSIGTDSGPVQTFQPAPDVIDGRFPPAPPQPR